MCAFSLRIILTKQIDAPLGVESNQEMKTIRAESAPQLIHDLLYVIVWTGNVKWFSIFAVFNRVRAVCRVYIAENLSCVVIVRVGTKT